MERGGRLSLEPDGSYFVAPCSRHVATGRISGIVVIDADPRNGSNKTIKLRVQELGPLSRTVKARSGGGGTHRVYEYPDFKVNSDSNGKLRGPGLDVLS